MASGTTYWTRWQSTHAAVACTMAVFGDPGPYRRRRTGSSRYSCQCRRHATEGACFTTACSPVLYNSTDHDTVSSCHADFFQEGAWPDNPHGCYYNTETDQVFFNAGGRLDDHDAVRHSICMRNVPGASGPVEQPTQNATTSWCHTGAGTDQSSWGTCVCHEPHGGHGPSPSLYIRRTSRALSSICLCRMPQLALLRTLCWDRL